MGCIPIVTSGVHSKYFNGDITDKFNKCCFRINIIRSWNIVLTATNTKYKNDYELTVEKLIQVLQQNPQSKYPFAKWMKWNALYTKAAKADKVITDNENSLHKNTGSTKEIKASENFEFLITKKQRRYARKYSEHLHSKMS